MATDAFIQAGNGEVAITHVLALKTKGFWTLEAKKIEADLYEAKHPGVTVRRDWETQAEHAERVKARDAMPRPDTPTMGMDPARARPELMRVQRSIEGLDPNHPEYDKLFASLTSQARALEDICGLQHVEYKNGVVPKKAKETASPEAMAKLTEYFKRSNDTRRKSIAATSDQEYLTLIRDTEMTVELQVLAVARLEQLRANP